MFADWLRATRQFFTAKMSSHAISRLSGEITQRLFRLDCDKYWAAVGEYNVREYELHSVEGWSKADKTCRKLALEVLQEFITSCIMAKHPKPVNTICFAWDQLIPEWKKYYGVLSDVRQSDPEPAVEGAKRKRAPPKAKPAARTTSTISSPPPVKPVAAEPSAKKPSAKRTQGTPTKLPMAKRRKLPEPAPSTASSKVHGQAQGAKRSTNKPPPQDDSDDLVVVREDSHKATDLVGRLMGQLADQEAQAKAQVIELQREIKDLTRHNAAANTTNSQLKARVSELKAALTDEKHKIEQGEARIRELTDEINHMRHESAQKLEQQAQQSARELAELSSRLTAERDAANKQATAERVALEQEAARHRDASAALTSANAALTTELEEAKRRVTYLESAAAQGDFAKLVAFMEPQFSAIQSELRATNARSYELMRDLIGARSVQPPWGAMMPVQRSWESPGDRNGPNSHYRPPADEGRRSGGQYRSQSPENS
jgi:hypothetical protein